MEWDGGEITREPLKIVAPDDPVSCAIYARENDLLYKPVWKRFKQVAKREKSSLASSIRLSSGHTTQRVATSTGLKFLGHINKSFALTKEIVMPYGEMLQY
jgi:hypothetical protein